MEHPTKNRLFAQEAQSGKRKNHIDFTDLRSERGDSIFWGKELKKTDQ